MKAFLRPLTAFLIFSLLLYGFWLGLQSQHFLVTQVNLKLMDDRDPSYLFPKIKADLEPRAASFVGHPIWQIDIEKLVSSIEKDRRLQDLKVSRRWPDQLDIEIRPHQAVANILSDRAAVIYPMASDGSLFPAMGLDEVSDAPILRGNVFLKDRTIRDLALKLLAVLPREGSFSVQTVSEIYFDRNRGFVLALGPENYEVILGNEDFHKRVSYVSRVVEYLRSEDLRDRVIDSRFQKKVVVRLRNAS